MLLESPFGEPTTVEKLIRFVLEHQNFIIVIAIIIIIVLLYLIHISNIIKTTYLSDLRIGIRPHGIVIGEVMGLCIYSPINREEHCITLGSSGSGKSAGVGIPTFNAWERCGGHSFTIDIGGDIVRNLTEDNFLIFDPLNPGTIAYNPFHFVDRMHDKISQDEALKNMAIGILPVKKDADGSSQWYDQAAQDMLAAILITKYHEGLDFRDICRYVLKTSSTEIFEHIDIHADDDTRDLINQFAELEPRLRGNVTQALNRAVLLFASPRLENAFHRPRGSEKVISAEDIEQSSIAMIIPDKQIALYSPIVALVVNQLLEYLSDRPPQYKSKILVAIDEYGSFSGIMDLTEALQKYRKRNVRIMILMQSLASLDRNYGELARRDMMENIGITVICKLNDLETEKYFSAKSGEKDVSRPSADGKPTHPVYRPIYRPIDFERLRHKAIVLAGGYSMKIDKRYYYKGLHLPYIR